MTTYKMKYKKSILNEARELLVDLKADNLRYDQPEVANDCANDIATIDKLLADEQVTEAEAQSLMSFLHATVLMVVNNDRNL